MHECNQTWAKVNKPISVFLVLHMILPDFPDLNDLLLNLSHVPHTFIMVFSYKVIQWVIYSSVWFWKAPIERLLFQIFFHSQISSKRVRLALFSSKDDHGPLVSIVSLLFLSTPSPVHCSGPGEHHFYFELILNIHGSH